MKVLIVGANGLLGSGAVAALSEGNEIIQASRTGDVSVDLTDPKSIAAMYEKVGKVDAVISATGKVPFKTLSELSLADYQSGINDKILGQVELVRQGLEYVNDGGSFTPDYRNFRTCCDSNWSCCFTFKRCVGIICYGCCN